MGIILGKFRKKKTTEEELEMLHETIKSVKVGIVNMFQDHKRKIKWFTLTLVILFLLIIVCFMFYFPPTAWDIITFYIIALAFGFTMIICGRGILMRYYKQKQIEKRIELENLNDEKEKHVKIVMETETYNKAKVILDKYAAEQIRKSATFPVPSTDTHYDGPWVDV